MAARAHPVSPARARAGYAILLALASFVVWLVASQARFNPAVIVAMNHPKGAARVLSGQQETDSLTARILSGDRAQSPARAGDAAPQPTPPMADSSGRPQATPQAASASRPATPFPDSQGLQAAPSQSLGAASGQDRSEARGEGLVKGNVMSGGESPGLGGFQPLGPVEAYDAQTLSDKIDGKAELYLASAFQEMACRPFAVGDARVEVFLYAMESPKDAFAVFSAQRRPGAQTLSLADSAYATENALFLAQGRFYAEFVADKASPELLPALEGLAQALLTALPRESAQDAPAGATGLSERELFPSDGLRPDSLRLAVSDALGMEGLANVYTAEYILPQGEAGAFLALRATPQEAAAQAGAYLKFLETAGFKRADLPGAPAGAVVMALDSLVQVVFSSGRAFAGVHDAANREAALEMTRRLSDSLASRPDSGSVGGAAFPSRSQAASPEPSPPAPRPAMGADGRKAPSGSESIPTGNIPGIAPQPGQGGKGKTP